MRVRRVRDGEHALVLGHAPLAAAWRERRRQAVAASKTRRLGPARVPAARIVGVIAIPVSYARAVFLGLAVGIPVAVLLVDHHSLKLISAITFQAPLRADRRVPFLPRLEAFFT